MQLKPKRKRPANVYDILFDNKGVELINIARIMHDPDVTSAISHTSTKISIPMVTYSLTSPLASKIFNLNQFVHSLDLEEFLSNPNQLPCIYENSAFVDKYHQHIVTGDLRIKSHSHLRKLFSKGPKFRETKSRVRQKLFYTRTPTYSYKIFLIRLAYF